MRKCPKCGTEIEEGMEFCPNCGESMSDMDLRQALRERMAERQSMHMETLPNARELGGLMMQDGRMIKKKVLLRSYKLADASEEDRRRLIEEYHLERIVDLRGIEEAMRVPDPEYPGATIRIIPVIDEENFGRGKDGVQHKIEDEDDPVKGFINFLHAVDISDMYEKMLLSPFSQKAFRAFFDEVLALGDGAILWHCMTGKDRTGLAAALLLEVLGADRDLILDEFALTNVMCADRIARAKQHFLDSGVSEEDASLAVTMAEGVSEAYLARALDAVTREYGSVDRYLSDAIGLSEEEKEIIREKFLD